MLYFHNFDSPFHSQADLVLSKLVNSAWQLFLSSLTLDEYFHNALRFTRLPKIEAMKENGIKYLATFDHDFDKVFEEGRIKKFEL